jgi:hypothetical protein
VREVVQTGSGLAVHLDEAMGRDRSALQNMVRERGQRLRALDYDSLADMENGPAEHVNAGGRAGTIATFCQTCDGEYVAVVLRGSLGTFIPRVKSVVRDGFYKYRNGSVKDMADDDLHNFDPLFSN